MEQYRVSYQEILDLIDGMMEEEIFTPGFYEWTGGSNLLSFLNTNTASHYNWATRNIRTTVILLKIIRPPLKSFFQGGR